MSKTAITIGLVAAVAASPMSTIAVEDVQPTVLRDIAYATTSEAQALDLYLLEGVGPFPVVVLIHGSGFFTGDKAMYASHATHLEVRTSATRRSHRPYRRRWRSTFLSIS